jgi:hypothetical protein
LSRTLDQGGALRRRWRARRRALRPPARHVRAALVTRRHAIPLIGRNGSAERGAAVARQFRRITSLYGSAGWMMIRSITTSAPPHVSVMTLTGTGLRAEWQAKSQTHV